jgi:hypothetical protein
MCENAWRAENCPESEALYCSSPYPCGYCEGAWHCEDIYNISVEVMEVLDQNQDGQIDASDIETEHLDMLNE